MALRLTGGGGERQVGRLAGAGEARLGAGDRARMEILAGAGDGFLGAGDTLRAERLTGAGEGRLGAGEPARGGGERRVDRFGAGDGRLGAGDFILVFGGGERCTLLRRGVKEVLLSLPRSSESMSPCIIASDSLSSGSSMSSSSSSSISGSDVGKVGSMSWGMGLCLAASRSLIRVM